MNDVSSSRGLHVGLAAIAAVAVVGFFAGTQPPVAPEPHGAQVHPNPNEQPARPPAPTYLGLRTATVGANSGWSSDFGALAAALPARTDAVAVTDAERAAAYAARLDNRAYDGAPPTIPHPINDVGVPECAACHTTGIVVDGRIARPMSHPHYTSCTQCHVPSGQAFGGRPSEGALEHAEALGGRNAFGGHRWPQHGARAWDGAPPTIPHPTWMRQNCDTCHGVAGVHGLRSTHPERQSCTQCHAPDALLDQRPLGLAEIVR